jgi:hypothetical protein
LIVASDSSGQLVLFNAADPANLGWFSRYQFYVEANDAYGHGK